MKALSFILVLIKLWTLISCTKASFFVSQWIFFEKIGLLEKLKFPMKFVKVFNKKKTYYDDDSVDVDSNDSNEDPELKLE